MSPSAETAAPNCDLVIRSGQVFDGAGAPLLSHLADMRAVDLKDLRELERELARSEGDSGAGREVEDD